MPDDLVLFAVMCDSVNASAEAVRSQYRLFSLGVTHLERLVVKEEVRRLLAIFHGHRIVIVKALAIARDCYELRA
jgi:hypothetical protein